VRHCAGLVVSLKADTGSGDVRLRLGPDASFEVIAEMGSGDIVSRYPDAEPIVRKREVIGYRRGAARTRISVDTGSGNLILEPGDSR
jgi:putative adhesin